MQAASSEHKNFGQPVVSDVAVVPQQEAEEQPPLTPAQAAARFQIPDALWISPTAAASFVRAWHAQRRSNSKP